MKIIYFHTCCSRYSKSMKDLIQRFCSENSLDYEIFDCDEDPDVMSDYNVYGNPPAFLVLSESGRRIATHKGKFTEEDLKKILTNT